MKPGVCIATEDNGVCTVDAQGKSLYIYEPASGPPTEIHHKHTLTELLSKEDRKQHEIMRVYSVHSANEVFCSLWPWWC